MQIQPYHRDDVPQSPPPGFHGPLVEYNGHYGYGNWHGHPGHSSVHAEHLKQPSLAPSYVQVLLQQIRKRWKLLIFWMILTAGAAGFVMVKFAKPSWKAEAALYYAPNFGVANQQLYRPPNIQTILALAKSPDILETAADENNLGPAGPLQNKLTVAIVKQSDIISVSFDGPNKEVSEKVANRVVELAIEHYGQLRKKLLGDAVATIDKDLKQATEEELAAKKELGEMLGREKIYDLQTEKTLIIHEISHLAEDIKKAELEMTTLDDQIAASTKEINEIAQEGKGNGKVTESEQARLRDIDETKKSLSQKKLDVANAKIALDPLEKKRLKYLPLYQGGFITPVEMADLERDIAKERAIIAQGQQDIATLEERLSRLEKTEIIPEGLRQAKRERSRFEITRNVIPGRIVALQKSLDERRKYQVVLLEVEKRAQVIQQRIDKWVLLRNTAIGQKKQHEVLESEKMAELTVHAAASAGSAPSASNHVKLGAGTFALSMFLFVTFVALRDMPRAMPAAMAAVRVNSQLPVPIWQHVPPPPPPPPHNVPPPPARDPNWNNDQLRSLAQRIAPGPSEQGKIVLFTPTSRGLRLENLVGDLACLLPKESGRSLVFEARTMAEDPSYPVWTGPSAKQVADNLESFLGGRSERASDCFAETMVSSVDYARGDLSHHLQNVMAMYRFRRLMNDMRERYSVVLMITPERCQSDEDDVFATLGEGIVVAINQDSNPHDVEQYLRELRACETPVYGAFTVPPGHAN